MPRTGALLPLSREHHSSLVLARAARRAANDQDLAACLFVMKRMEAHWHALMAAHFEREEALVQLASDTLNPESVERIRAEHAELRILVCGPCSLELTERLSRFSDLMVTHIRYEERTLFPQLQSHACIKSVATFNSAVPRR